MQIRATVLLALLVAVLAVFSACDSNGASDETALQPWPKPTITLQAAVETAQAKFPDARCTEASYSEENWGPMCTIGLVLGDQCHIVKVDGTTGAVLESLDTLADEETQKVVEAFAKLSPGVSLLQAVNNAVKEHPSFWPMIAQLGNENGKIIYQVLQGKGKRTKIARVSAADGKVESVDEVDEAKLR